MNFAATAPSAAPSQAGLDALLPSPAAAGTGAEGVSAFLDMLGLLNGLAAPVETADAETEPADESADTPADEAPAMPAMAAVPAQLVIAAPVLPLALPSEEGPAADADAGVPLDVASVAQDTPRRQAAPQTALPASVAIDPAAKPVRAEATAPVSDAPDAAPVRVAAAAPSPELRKATEFHLDDVRAPVTAAVPAANATDDTLPALKLSPSTPTQWRQPLTEALGDRLQLHLQRGSDQAVIRLDPPQLGRIEIAIRHEAGSLQVHLSATHGEVVRQLNAIGDSLRQDLGQRQYGDVSVVVSDAGAMARDADGRSRGRQPQAQDTDPNRALAEAETGFATAFRLGDNTSETR